ncbi:acetyltransferase [mine drainage metagenome]|uniref:Acetyltransferase n=1 Tax=mine drainage metagenome TaxID=410659 RepID=T1C7N6_9ZZZZ
MKLNNTRIDWAKILEEQKEHHMKLYPDAGMEASYHNLIDLLNENRIPSRVIIKDGNVIAYTFYIDSSGESDRIYAIIGFKEEGKVDERVHILSKWLKDEAQRNNKILILNGIFNEPENFDSILEEDGIRKLERIRMEAIIENCTFEDAIMNAAHYNYNQINQLKIEELSEIIFDSFKGEADRILIPSNSKREVNFSQK